MDGTGKQRNISYLLRLWQVSSGGGLVWRASLENPRTGEQRGFANLADLVTFLPAAFQSVMGCRLAIRSSCRATSGVTDPRQAHS